MFIVNLTNVALDVNFFFKKNLEFKYFFKINLRFKCILLIQPICS